MTHCLAGTTLPNAAETLGKCLASRLALCSAGLNRPCRFAPASDKPKVRVAKNVALGPRAVRGLGLGPVPGVPWWKMGPLLWHGDCCGLGHVSVQFGNHAGNPGALMWH